MKSLVLCVCVLILTFQFSDSSELRKRIKDTISNTFENDIEDCKTENNVTRDDWYTIEDIVANIYAKPENEVRTKNVGCWIACVMKKQNLMEESNIKEAEVQSKVDLMFGLIDGEGGTEHRIARKCMKEVRSTTEECEKCFSLMTCVSREVHNAVKHEEHEKEGEKGKAETAQAE